MAIWSADDIKTLRQRYDETPSVFCGRIGVKPDALRIWEQGRGAPNGSAELLLDRLLEDVDAGEIRPHPDNVNGRQRTKHPAAAAS